MKGIYRLRVHLPAFFFVTGSAPSATGSVYPTPSSVETAISQRFYLRFACGGTACSEEVLPVTRRVSPAEGPQEPYRDSAKLTTYII